MRTGPEPEGGRGGDSRRTVAAERQQLMNLAYRLLGSLADAEDVVQETYARWYAMTPAERDAIDTPAAWLSKVAGRICLDLLRSARVRREKYVGHWLPEPLPNSAEWAEARIGTGADPVDRVTLDESISMAFLVMLESMTPAERVAFILHDVFRYPFADIAETVGRTPEACRQLASSARRRIGHAERPVPPSAQRAHIVKDFKHAWEAKDVDALLVLLDPDSTVVSDGGGNATAAVDPIEGAEQVARFFVDIADVADKSGDLITLERTVNGQPGLVAQVHGVTVTVFAFNIVGGRITHIWAIRNPDKLHPWI